MNASERPVVEMENNVSVDVESGYVEFIPQLFREQPVEYFESVGKNIKPGEIKRDDSGKVREDPSAVKVLPVWTNADGKELFTVAKRVNPSKGNVGASGDPFYEYDIIKTVNSIDLPAPKPIAKCKQAGHYLIVMEKIEGISWYDKNELALREKGYSDAEILELYRQAEEMMEDLQQKFNEAGIIRNWKLKDMIFDIDFTAKRVRGMIPTDWERTDIDFEKLEAYKKKMHTTAK